MNNEQLIKYISEHSKHPYAAMIAEQLLTGLKVEVKLSNGSWMTAECPNWDPRLEYRLVKKPAYRVYRYIGEQGTNTQDRYSDGRLSQNGDEDQVVYLTDWIEYTGGKDQIAEMNSAKNGVIYRDEFGNQSDIISPLPSDTLKKV